MRTLLGVCTLSLVGAGLPAQVASSNAVVVLQQTANQSCPVDLTAQHAAAGGLVATNRNARRPGQSYRLTFSPGDARGISQAKVTLHGLSGAQVLPAAAEKPRRDATESFNLSPSSDRRHLFHSMIYTDKLTGVLWVELNELTYADGTQWHESATATCRVAPNGFMLVASGL